MYREAPVAAIVYRGNVVENTHIAHIAVVDAQGRRLCGFGDPSRVTLARSAAKPAQALAVMETGALERFGLDDADLALMCASHNSEARHIQRALAMLAKSGAQESDLRCGGHPPISEAVHRTWIKTDFTPTPACSNCSGKHAGMLAAARAIGEPVQDYHLPQHPLQAHVKRTMADVCALPDDAIQWAIDGCNLPTPAFPLERLAFLYARLADAAGLDDSAASPRNAALARIYRAMTSHPALVAGEGRFCTALMRAFAGELVGKAGAEACYAIGLRAAGRPGTLPGQGAVGVAVKVEDGNKTILYAIVCEILKRLQIGTAEQREMLAAFHRPKLLNTRQVETGRIELTFSLE
ncbi:asparaginase [Litchfieldella rifensis]|uniref:Asparaginase n=1 Tax=Litchfieldella rifensis TaxID=762643 RepID=A0ABV7LLS3_9GAMM